MAGVISETTRKRDEIVEVGRSLFDRCLTSGSTGNISVRLSDGSTLLTPTGSSLGTLDPERLSLFDSQQRFVSGDKPTKEAFLHRCMYCSRSADNAVVHLHSTHAVAVSILNDVDARDVIPPITAYYVMRVGRLPLVPFHPPGDEALALAVGREASEHHAILLANHGPIVSAADLREAQYAIEELEETAKIFLMLHGRRIRPLTAAQAEVLR